MNQTPTVKKMNDLNDFPPTVKKMNDFLRMAIDPTGNQFQKEDAKVKFFADAEKNGFGAHLAIVEMGSDPEAKLKRLNAMLGYNPDAHALELREKDEQIATLQSENRSLRRQLEKKNGRTSMRSTPTKPVRDPESPSNRATNLTQESVFRPIIFALLQKNGKSMLASTLKNEIPAILAERGISLTEDDLRSSPSRAGSPKWKTTVQTTRNHMVSDGLIKKNSQRDVWELVDHK